MGKQRLAYNSKGKLTKIVIEMPIKHNYQLHFDNKYINPTETFSNNVMYDLKSPESVGAPILIDKSPIHLFFPNLSYYDERYKPQSGLHVNIDYIDSVSHAGSETIAVAKYYHPVTMQRHNLELHFDSLEIF